MFGYIIRRLISGVLVLLVVSVSVFALFFYGPSDPALAYCPETRCTPQRLEAVRTSLGLDEPVVQQYTDYMAGIFTGNDFQLGSIAIECPAPCLGVSFKLRLPVTEYLISRFPATLSLALGGAVIFLTTGVGMGIMAARKRGTGTDKGIVGVSLFINAIPYYLLALLAYLFLISQWAIFPESGYYGPFTEGPLAWVKGMLLAWLVIGLSYSTQYARFSRGSMIESLNEDYVRTARAKGLSERQVTLKHGLRAAIVPVVTIFGLDFAYLLTGTIFTERIFGIQGIGVTALDAIGNKDLPVISATVLIAAAFIVVANIIVDIIYSVIDPRVRLT
ncbi:ABC transporter permease [Nocardioides mesophilus]|uniref:ABC transporter permease n=1 Tax=Nocardioides mesophilus TaxID=433659 RepID=A0A7G9RA99_9ACTN|nr:ABC transporter permease [Nocardioides mesophilus]QNN52524.1 ABC transporter permease [Nocardioides mesophilus]